MGKKDHILIFCSLLFMGMLVIADFSSVKIFQWNVFGLELLVPAGTFAFAVTFLATDVIGEIWGRAHALAVVWFGVFVRALLLAYGLWVVGGASGDAIGGVLVAPEFWTTENQQSFAFVFTSTISIYVAGFVAIIVASLIDVYVFHELRERHKGRSLFWLRNNVSTILAQVINSTVFITLAFASTLNFQQLSLAIAGQCLMKSVLAVIDTPIAYLLRNYGLGKAGFYKFWTSEFWQG